ncbi:sn-glycerol 3-phosphate transport system permease protein [Streptomyces sp. LBL]|uniref:carbohydrate ABC transporter permease n=1 Tax=Streptomyces sp. LBL TaxID=2940562 RepID=UPI0024756D57|nr:sugar ABC transporter permease [Streptomyces sp. LBL]MDH6622265.1 sn-glycerol 3-phosphate transport system permease protein [Streptomyces sp. LBL]
MHSTDSSRPTVRWGRAGIGPWLVVPGLALLVVFVFRPLVRTLQLSTYASDLIGNPTRFVGLDNYVSLLTDSDFLHTVTISIVIALLGMVLATVGALCAALLLRRRLMGAGFFNVIFSLPFAYSAASASAVFAGLFAPSVGVLNIILANFGSVGPHWLSDPFTAVWAIAIATAWYEFGFAFLVLTAAVRDVPPEIIEAAQLDGAGGFRLAARILVPIMRPSILFLVVTQTITGLQSFAQIQVLTRGGPAGATTTLVYRLYQLAFGNGTPDFGRASVIAIILILIVTAITALQFRLFGREKTA